MKSPAVVLIILVLFASLPCARGDIGLNKQLTIDLTDVQDATKKATWSGPNELGITEEGIGWDAPNSPIQNGWIQSRPLPLGCAWRAPEGFTARVSVQAAPRATIVRNGRKQAHFDGKVFVRYSPDLVHWSTWQILQPTDPPSGEVSETLAMHFSGEVQIPSLDRKPYDELLAAYAKLDVPWRSDEEAAVRWVLKQDPDFFSKQIPLVGYIEILFESRFEDKLRIQALNATVFCSMGGVTAIPKDPSFEYPSGPWKFRAKQAAEKQVLETW